MSETFDLTVTKTIPAPAKAVFEAWLDPKALSEFMIPGPGMTVPKAEVDGKEGGSFFIVMKAGDKEIPHQGQYKKIDPYTTLSFTWISPHSPDASLVTISLREISDSATELTLRHTGLPSAESRDNHQGGWTHIVETLAKRLS